MVQTYSTLNREMAAGQIYSTHRAAIATPPAPRRTGPQTPSPGQAPSRIQPPSRTQSQSWVQAPEVPAPRRFSFQLSPLALPAARAALPGVSGRVTLEGRPGQPFQVTGELSGLAPAPDPAIEPWLWLIHDLTVPLDLDPADLAALPRGAGGGGNQPGSVFTMDGKPPTYGPEFNTLSIAVSPGRFTRSESNSWRLQATLNPTTNKGFHPLYFVGPEALADPNTPIPSGTLAHILTDMFMRPATVHPELSADKRYPERLKAIVAHHLGGGQSSVLDGSGFTRAAVTLEGLVRPIPVLMPTRESCILLGENREES